MAFTESFCEDQIKKYTDAEAAILLGAQDYEIDGRKITRANLTSIRNGIEYWIGKKNNAINGDSKLDTFTPVFGG